MLFSVNASAQKKKTPARKKAAPAEIEIVKTAPEELLLVTKAQEAFKPGPADTEGWSLYTSEMDLFKLAFPPTPVVTDSLDSQGKKDGNRYYNPAAFTDAKISLALTVSPLGAANVDDDLKRKIYNAWAEGLVGYDGRMKTVKVSEKEFAAAGSFGLEVVADHGEFRVQARMICPADKCYYLVVGSATPGALKEGDYAQVEKWTKKFFDSFQVIKEQPRPVQK
jgi:hypothetical protein